MNSKAFATTLLSPAPLVLLILLMDSLHAATFERIACPGETIQDGGLALEIRSTGGSVGGLGPSGLTVKEFTFRTGATVTRENDEAIVAKMPGEPLEILMREGSPLSGDIPAGTLFRGAHDFHIDHDDRIAMGAGVFIPGFNRGRDLIGNAVLMITNDRLTVLTYEGKPGAEGTIFRPGKLAMSIDGRVALQGEWWRSSDSVLFSSRIDSGVWAGDPASGAAPLVLTDTPYPGMVPSDDDAVFTLIDSGDLAINKRGQLLFWGVLEWRPTPFVTARRAAVCIKDGDAVWPIAIINDTAAGFSEGITYDDFGAGGLAADGSVWMRASIKGSGVSNGNDECLFATHEGEVFLVVQEGSKVPGITGATFGPQATTPDGISDAGAIVFHDNVYMNDGSRMNTIWMWSGGTLSLIARDGDEAPGLPGITFSKVSNPAISRDGTIVYSGVVPGSRQSRMWMARGASSFVPVHDLETDIIERFDGSQAEASSPTVSKTAVTNGFDDYGRILTLVSGSCLAWMAPEGVLAPPAGTISGYVFEDTNNDRIVSAGDIGIAGVDVALFRAVQGGNSLGEALQSGVTDPDGSYSFEPVAPGDYVIVESDPADFESVFGHEGNRANHISVTLLPGDISIGNNFLDRERPPSLGPTLRVVGIQIRERRMSVTVSSRSQQPMTLWRNSSLMPGTWTEVTDPIVNSDVPTATTLTDPVTLAGDAYFRVTQGDPAALAGGDKEDRVE